MSEQMLALDGTESRSAFISSDGRHRYSLTREWSPGESRIVFCMLNPSTADANVDDPTIRRCIGFAKAWGYDGLVVVNLFAYRATSPADMFAAGEDAVGIINSDIIANRVENRDVVVAWGAHGGHMRRDAVVGQLIERKARSVASLGLTKSGHPRHPLYVPAAQPRIPWTRIIP